MNICSMNKSTLERVIAALRVHHDDPRMGGGLAAKIKREEMPASLAGLFGVWPADEDGIYRIPLTDNGLALVWRAYAIAEIAAGRGRLASLDKHSECLGIVNFDPAFVYVCDQMRGRGVRPCLPPKLDGCDRLGGERRRGRRAAEAVGPVSLGSPGQCAQGLCCGWLGEARLRHLASRGDVAVRDAASRGHPRA